MRACLGLCPPVEVNRRRDPPRPLYTPRDSASSWPGFCNRLILPMKPLLTFLFLAALNAQTYQPTWDSIDKRPTPAWFTDAKFGIFIHWGLYSVPAYAPVIPGKLAYAEWYWNALTNGKGANPNPVQAGTWAFHRRHYGADYAYESFDPQFRAELFD